MSNVATINNQNFVIFSENFQTVQMDAKIIDFDSSADDSDFLSKPSNDDDLIKATYMSKVQRFFCPACNVKYTKLKYLKTHLKSCGQTFQCENCPAIYKQKRSLVVHMKKSHSILTESEFDDEDNTFRKLEYIEEEKCFVKKSLHKFPN